MKRRLLAGAAITLATCLTVPGAASAALGCGDTITKDTKLKKDIHCPVGQGGLTIGADGVTLDLNGHTIQGDDSDATSAVSVDGMENTRIRGGTLSGFGMGVKASNGAGLLVTRLKIQREEQVPVRISGYNRATVSRSLLKGSGLEGVSIADSEDVTVAKNTITNGGVVISGGSDLFVLENSITETGGFGPSAISGIAFFDVATGWAAGNSIAQSARHGIEASGGSHVQLLENAISGSELDGIDVYSGATSVRISKNRVRGGDVNGIHTQDGTGASIRNNDVKGAALTGILNQDDSIPVVGNTANGNGGYGIDSASGALSHDNKAKQNGNPAQCTPAEACNQAKVAARRGADLFASVATHRHGPYNVTNAKVRKKGKTKTFYVRVKNVSGAKQNATLDDRSTPLGNFGLQWFDGNDNVTHAAFGNGYDFKLAKGAKKTFEARVTPKVKHPGELCLFGAFLTPPDDEAYGFVYVNSNSVCG